MPKHFRPEQLTLSNGIPVILQHYEGSVAATYWWIQTGSADENAPEAGFAHFLEHMLFKDAAAKETGKASTGQMARAIESLGGEINAYTSFDQTVYHVTCAAQHWEKVIDAFGVMAKPQKFLKSDFEREREVILEELKKNEDSPSRQLFQQLFSSTFKKHPYGRPVIGYVKTLKAANVGHLDSFYKRNYVSEKMGLILVGPVGQPGTREGDARRKKLIELLEKHYGKSTIPRRPKKEFKRPVEPILRNKPEFSIKHFDVKTPTLSFSFRAPDLKHPDVAALDLASSVLASGELSRLYRRLFYGSSLVTDVSGGLYVPNDPGMLYFQAEMDDSAKIFPVAEQMLDELQKLAAEGPTDEELARVMVGSESERLYSSQTADGMASRLGFVRFVLGDLNYDEEYLEDLRNVDSQRIRDVLSQYLDIQRMSCVVLLPKDQKDFDLAGLEKLFTKRLAPAQNKQAEKAAKKVAAKPVGRKLLHGAHPELIERDSGLKVIYRANPQSHVMSIHTVALGGLRLELANPVESVEKDWGSSYLMALTWSKGTRTKNAEQIARIVEGSAAGLDGFSGRNTVGVQMTGLARDWNKLSGVLSEVLVEPTFPEDELVHSKRVAEDSIRGIEDHSAQLCSKLFLETLFEKHPYGKLTTGSLESMKTIHSEKLRKFHRNWIRPERLVVSVSGNVKRKELDQWVTDLEARLKSSASGGPSESGKGKSGNGLLTLEDEAALKGPRWVEKSLGREQLHIIVGGVGSRIDWADRYPLQIMSTLLGGQSGRLFIELREKKSLAYTVAPISFDGVERGYAGTYIACSPQKKDEALQGIRQVLERLAEKGPSPSEMKRAKEFFLGRRAMDLQSDSALATHFGLEMVYGLKNLDDEMVIKRIEAVAAKDIQNVCRKFLVDPHMVTSIVG